jgi:hypothetical protein
MQIDLFKIKVIQFFDYSSSQLFIFASWDLICANYVPQHDFPINHSFPNKPLISR